MLIVWNVKWQPNGYGIPLGVEKLESRRDGIENCTVHEFFQFRFFFEAKNGGETRSRQLSKDPVILGERFGARDDVFSYTK